MRRLFYIWEISGHFRLVGLCAICFCLLVVASACESDEVYPMQISFTEYLPYETACDGIDFLDEEVIIINSKNALKRHIVCEDIKLPEINFKKHSLLLVKGCSNSGIGAINVRLSKVAIDKYAMDIILSTDMTTAAPSWMVSGITPKIKDTDEITLNIQQVNF